MQAKPKDTATSFRQHGGCLKVKPSQLGRCEQPLDAGRTCVQNDHWIHLAITASQQALATEQSPLQATIGERSKPLNAGCS